jgi:tetratricopeptide (TPR) repeat protein
MPPPPRSPRSGGSSSSRGRGGSNAARGTGRPGGGRPQSSSARPDPAARRVSVREPELPDEATAALLDRSVRDAVLGLGGPLAAAVARHLAAVGLLLDDDPEAALAHAQYAKDRAGRLPDVREALGLAAYAAGRYDLARAELRAARRMTGRPDLLPVLADCERGLGHPERALQVAAEPGAQRLGPADRVELAIVVAGARRDMGQFDAALQALEVPALRSGSASAAALRVRYAYADTLAMAGRRADARTWFLNVASVDEGDETDALDRADELAAE